MVRNAGSGPIVRNDPRIIAAARGERAPNFRRRVGVLAATTAVLIGGALWVRSLNSPSMERLMRKPAYLHSLREVGEVPGINEEHAKQLALANSYAYKGNLEGRDFAFINKVAERFGVSPIVVLDTLHGNRFDDSTIRVWENRRLYYNKILARRGTEERWKVREAERELPRAERVLGILNAAMEKGEGGTESFAERFDGRFRGHHGKVEHLRELFEREHRGAGGKRDRTSSIPLGFRPSAQARGRAGRRGRRPY